MDSATKRFSMLNFGGLDDALPVADATIDQGDRQTFLGLYSGILADGGGGGPPAIPPGLAKKLQRNIESMITTPMATTKAN